MPKNSQATREAAATEEAPSPLLVGEAPRGLSEAAYERLLDMMLSGEMPAGSVLQERRLTDLLGISRTPIREALGRLESEGLVTRQFGRLLTVRQFTVQEFIEILNVRKILETEAASLAAGRIAPDQVKAVRTAIESLMKAKSPTVARHWEVDELVHGSIAEASGNRTLWMLIRDLRRHTHIFNLRRIPSRFHDSCREHLALMKAVADGDGVAARTLIGEHIENVKLSIIEKLKSL